MTELTKDEYLKASNALATGFGPTTDFADPQLGTTVQGKGGIPDSAADLPGQVFSVDQLPNPAVAVAYGLPPVTVPAYLILDNADDALKHVQGKDPLDVLSGELRGELGDPALAFDNTIRSQGDSLMTLDARTGAGLADDSKTDDGSTAFVDGIKDGSGDTTTAADVEAPIDPAGVQKADGASEAASADAGTQGEPADTGDAGAQSSVKTKAPKGASS